MPEDHNKKVVRAEGGFFDDVWLYMRLVVRLLMDPRVNIFLKLIPVASFIYLIIPAPIPPDLIPTPIDDAMILWLGTYLFVELCPQDVVEEHKKALQLEIPGNWRDPSAADEEIVDAEWKDA